MKMPVPYVTLWSDEVKAQQEESDKFVAGRKHIPSRVNVINGRSYVMMPEGHPSVVDVLGVTFVNVPRLQTGVPLFGQVHALRHLDAMLGCCQVCGVRMDPQRPLKYLVSTPYDHNDPQDYINDPPTCEDCLDTTFAWCPHMMKGTFEIYQSQGWEIFGYNVRTLEFIDDEDEFVKAEFIVKRDNWRREMRRTFTTTQVMVRLIDPRRVA